MLEETFPQGWTTREDVSENCREAVTQEVASETYISIVELILEVPVLFIRKRRIGSQRGVKRELYGSRLGIGPENKEFRVISLFDTGAAPKADVKEEGVIVEEVFGDVVMLSSR